MFHGEFLVLKNIFRPGAGELGDAGACAKLLVPPKERLRRRRTNHEVGTII